MKKKFRRILAGMLVGALLVQSPNVALADSEKVVTLGADLTKDQKAAMLEYFGVSEDEVTILEVNNQEERAYLEGIATESEIGTRTYSCAYISPTNSGQINVKTAHLTWVSTSMIANTLVTAGIDSCDVIAAAPRDVSGTGALTGIIKAYEKVTDEELDEEKTQLAMEELYETAQLGSDIGQEQASAIMNEIKQQVLKDDVTDTDDVEKIVKEVAEYYDVNLTEGQAEKVTTLMSNIASQDYDYDAIKGTMEGLQDKLVDSIDNIQESFLENSEGGGGILAAIGNFFASIIKAIGNFFSGLFGGSDDDAEEQKEESILDDTNDSALGIEPTDEPTSQDSSKDTSATPNTGADNSSGDTTTQKSEEPTEQSDSFTVDDNSNVIQEDHTADDVDTIVDQSSSDLSLDVE